MNGQPRETSSQRFAGSLNSAPTSELSPEEPDRGSPANEDRARDLQAALHLVDDCFSVLARVAVTDRRAFLSDIRAQHAAKSALIDLGESIKRLPADFRTSTPEVNYSALIKLRDKLAHMPRGVDWEIIWSSSALDAPVQAAMHRRVLARRSGNS